MFTAIKAVFFGEVHEVIIVLISMVINNVLIEDFMNFV